MAPGPSNGDIFHGALSLCLCGSSCLEPKRHFPSFKGGKVFNGPKTVKKTSRRLIAAQYAGVSRSLGSKHVPLVANQIALNEAQAEARLFPELNEPKRRFSWLMRH
jgi:hypothetical protein